MPEAKSGVPTEEMKKAARIALNMPLESIMKLPEAQRRVLLEFRSTYADRKKEQYKHRRANRQVMRPGTRLKIKWLTYLTIGGIMVFAAFLAKGLLVSDANE